MTEETKPLPKQNRLEEAAIRESHLRHSIEADLQQLKKLLTAFPNLSEDELAHRLVWTKPQLRKVRKLLGE
jgi:hypothetical protein